MTDEPNLPDDVAEAVAVAIGDVCDEVHISQLHLAARAALAAAEPAIRADERAKVVAWLRARDSVSIVQIETYWAIADAIERGDHEEDKT